MRKNAHGGNFIPTPSVLPCYPGLVRQSHCFSPTQGKFCRLAARWSRSRNVDKKLRFVASIDLKVEGYLDQPTSARVCCFSCFPCWYIYEKICYILGKMLVQWKPLNIIIRLMLSLYLGPKVITLSGFNCIYKEDFYMIYMKQTVILDKICFSFKQKWSFLGRQVYAFAQIITK